MPKTERPKSENAEIRTIDRLDFSRSNAVRISDIRTNITSLDCFQTICSRTEGACPNPNAFGFQHSTLVGKFCGDFGN